MRTIKEYLEQEMGIKYPEDKNVSMEWFEKNNLPPVVRCSCCDSSMILFSAMIDKKGYTYCKNCAEGA